MKKTKKPSIVQPVKNKDTIFSSFSINKTVHIVILILLPVVLYFPSFNYQLTYYDDAQLIENIARFIHTKHAVTDIFSSSVFGSDSSEGDYYYRPLLILSFYLNVLLGGTLPAGFYIVNLFFHVTAIVLLYLFIRNSNYRPIQAFTCSLIFAVHPALVQAIAWIPGRNDSLFTVFAIGSMLFLIRYLKAGKLASFLLHSLFFLLALLTKETAILLPILFFFLIKILQKQNELSRNESRSIWLKLILSWSIPGILFFIVRKSVLGATIGLPLSFTIENFFKNTPALLQYFGKMFLPFNLSTFPVINTTTVLLGLATVVVLVYLLIISKNRRPSYLMFCGTWLLLFLLPAILRTSSEYESVFLEHRMYFPLIGFLLLWLETDFIRKMKAETKPVIAGFSGLLVMCFILSLNHERDYQNEFSYWSKAVTSSPNSSFAHRSLGIYYTANHQDAEAKNEYNKSLQVNPDIKEVRNNLGRIYLNEGNRDEARKLFLEELNMNPDNAMSYYNLGLLELKGKNISAADTLIRKSLLLNPNYPDAQNDLCVVLAMQKKYEEATNQCIKILEENPSYESAKNNLRLIFSVWNDSAKVSYYRNLIEKKGITIN